MCGIAGVISSSRPVVSDIYDSLINLQHRGQDAAGIMTADERMHKHKGLGYVKDVFSEKNIKLLTGRVGVGHTRYPTHGGFSHGEIQPFWTDTPYGIALAHNGNLVNYRELSEQTRSTEKKYLNTNSDTEVLLHLFSSALSKGNHPKNEEEFFEQICSAVADVFKKASGSFSVVAMIVGKGLVVFRDPYGIRPLVRGVREEEGGEKTHIFSSEPTMFYSLGYTSRGDVHPGEVIYISIHGNEHKRIIEQREFTPCVFEYVYFARPDAIENDISVYRARLRMGQNLAEQWKKRHPDKLPDIVIPAPSTANTAALSMAHALGVRYSEGLYKNPFIARTFIMPGQAVRKKSIRYKLTPQELEIRNKIVMIVDDSIVRGNTSREIAKMVRDYGAKKVYFVSAAPPIKFPCFYGVDMPTKSELIASSRDEENIESYLGVDALMYQRIEDLVEAVTRRGDHHIDRPCLACMDGNYITGDVNEDLMESLEVQREQHRENP